MAAPRNGFKILSLKPTHSNIFLETFLLKINNGGTMRLSMICFYLLIWNNLD